MKKYIFAYLFLFIVYCGISQDVTGSWILVTEGDMNELSINESDQYIGLERYDREQRPTGEREDLDMVESIQRDGYKLYIGQIPEEERYISLCFFETGEKGTVKLFVKERNESLEEARQFEKISDLGVRLYRRERMKEIQTLKSLKNITKAELITALEKLLNFLKIEVEKQGGFEGDAEVYVISELYHQFILLGYNPYAANGDIDELLNGFEKDSDVREIIKEIEPLLEQDNEETIEIEPAEFEEVPEELEKVPEDKR